MSKMLKASANMHIGSIRVSQEKWDQLRKDGETEEYLRSYFRDLAESPELSQICWTVEPEEEVHKFNMEIDLSVPSANWPGKERVEEEIEWLMQRLMNKTVNATDWSYLITWQDEEE